jgi:hypothetical protein
MEHKSCQRYVSSRFDGLWKVFEPTYTIARYQWH